jgi:hypothetical protein
MKVPQGGQDFILAGLPEYVRGVAGSGQNDGAEG